MRNRDMSGSSWALWHAGCIALATRAAGAGCCPISTRFACCVAATCSTGEQAGPSPYTTPGHGLGPAFHMIYRLTTALITVALIVAAAAMARADDPPTDRDIEKQILGKWFQELTVRGYDVKATTTYHPDGKFSGEGLLTKGERTLNMVVTGRWKLEGAKLTETVASCDPPLLRRGRRATTEIVEVSDTTLRFLTDKGEEMTKRRVTE